MRHHLTPLVLAFLALTPALPADAAGVDGGDDLLTGVELQLVEAAGDTWALVTVFHVLGMTIDADMRFLVDGSVVKSDPILAAGRGYFTARLGPADQPKQVCVEVDGRALLSGDTAIPSHAAACGEWFPNAARTPLAEAAPAPRAAAGAPLLPTRAGARWRR